MSSAEPGPSDERRTRKAVGSPCAASPCGASAPSTARATTPTSSRPKSRSAFGSATRAPTAAAPRKKSRSRCARRVTTRTSRSASCSPKGSFIERADVQWWCRAASRRRTGSINVVRVELAARRESGFQASRAPLLHVVELRHLRQGLDRLRRGARPFRSAAAPFAIARRRCSAGCLPRCKTSKRCSSRPAGYTRPALFDASGKISPCARTSAGTTRSTS